MEIFGNGFYPYEYLKGFLYFHIIGEMEIIGNKTHPSNKEYRCDACLFSCGNKKDFNRHLKTKKHERNMCVSKEEKTALQNICEICKRRYKSESGLWKHQQKCRYVAMKIVKGNEEADKREKEENQYTKMIMEVVEKNNELQKMLIEQEIQHTKNIEKIIPKIGNVTNNTTNNTTNEVNFNVFLNEYCKDAINISDFVHSLQVKFDDLENTCDHGHVRGISQIFINGLKDLDMYKRPLHCSNLNKKTLYVKDNDIWEKNDDKLRQAIINLNDKNTQHVPLLVEENVPQHENDRYIKFISDNLISEDDVNKDMEKIIKILAKEVAV